MKKKLKKETGKVACRCKKISKESEVKTPTHFVFQFLQELQQDPIREFHLFAGIGGGIYGGELLGHQCCGGVEIMPYAQGVLRQRQKDGWLPEFPIYGDLCELNGNQFKGSFDVLCGGFPCQAFSSAAHGKNIPEKNLWDEMFRFVKESDAPIVFGENVVLRAIKKAKVDLESVGYKVQIVRLSNADLGADHQRFRFWLLAVKDDVVFEKVRRTLVTRKNLNGGCWEESPDKALESVKLEESCRSDQLLGVGNAQSPLVAATAFRILVNRHINQKSFQGVVASEDEISKVFDIRKTWIKNIFGDSFGLIHTPTTVANYCCASMQKHPSCRNYIKVFCSKIRRPSPIHAEYLMGFPIGASCCHPQPLNNIIRWRDFL